MAKAPTKGLQIAVDASDLTKFANKATKAKHVTTPMIMAGLNQVGDGLVAVLSRNLSRQTGLALENVLGLIRVDRATGGDLEYEIMVDTRLINTGKKALPGQREVREFGTDDPNTLVIIVSKDDELVCMDCEVLARSGPMSIQVAQAHIPAHPNCRCVILPYVQPRKRMPVTMTTVTGTDPVRRTGVKPMPTDADTTLRQLAQAILDRTATTIRVQLS